MYREIFYQQKAGIYKLFHITNAPENKIYCLIINLINLKQEGKSDLLLILYLFILAPWAESGGYHDCSSH